jgi:biopolymer transport protein ExbB
MQFSFFELWPAMGPLAKGVVLLLAGMSLTSLAVATEKWLRLRRAAGESGRFLSDWRVRLAADGFETAARDADRYPHSFVAHAVACGTHVLAATTDADVRLEAYDRTIRRIVQATATGARQGLGVLATVGSTAPFVGLFGTVVGIVNAFHQMGLTGQGGLAVVSAGIAEALVATALGIGVAIPALWLYNYLTQRIQRAVAEIECVADELAVAALGAGHTPQRGLRQVHVAGR